MDNRIYLEKVYGGLLGKCVGVRLGAPVEPTIWTYERIRSTYGDIRGYIKEFRTFAADDDINGPLFFIRALIDKPAEHELTPADVGRAWLSYTREGIGFYWWGGYGRSTEHTAYLNLKAGLEAPLSGSLAVNGATAAEQIGGQIFIDSWGWVIPGDYREAARCAGIAASVGHDRNGIYGGQFIAAAVSLAFVEPDIAAIMEKALTVIPADSEYARVVTAVRSFHAAHPDSWRAARDMLEAEFGYDRYPGVCHIIPNAGVCALALCYGEGDFARTVEIATMCGWDTDCNAGNVGAILGVFCGPEAIPDHYRRPINDFHAASSIAGALNIIDLPTAARELAALGLQLRGQPVPEAWIPGLFSDDIHLDFSLPGSCGGLRSSSSLFAPIGAVGTEPIVSAMMSGLQAAPTVEAQRKPIGRVLPESGDGARAGVPVLIDRMKRGDNARIFYKPYYAREEFDDERYSPTFTPLAYPGQRMTLLGRAEGMVGRRIAVAPFVRDSRSKDIVEGGFRMLEDDARFQFDWELPEVGFAIDEAGLAVMNFEADTWLGRLWIEGFSITGRRRSFIAFRDEREEFKGLSRCSLDGGAWALENEGLRVLTNSTFRLYTGPYYMKHGRIACSLVPEYGTSHLVSGRNRGTETGYCFGFDGENRVRMIRRDHGAVVLAEAEFPWNIGQRYHLELELAGARLTGSIDGSIVLECSDADALPYGMAGCAKLSLGRTWFASLEFEEYPE